MKSNMHGREFRSISRRELLKLSPVAALGAFAIPGLRMPLLRAGLDFSDWASAGLFRSGHPAPTFSDSDLTPLKKFPLNSYNGDIPEPAFDKWTLKVTGAVQKPGDYTLSQIQGLSKVRQNTGMASPEGPVRLVMPVFWGVQELPASRLWLTPLQASVTKRFCVLVGCARTS